MALLQISQWLANVYNFNLRNRITKKNTNKKGNTKKNLKKKNEIQVGYFLFPMERLLGCLFKGTDNHNTN